MTDWIIAGASTVTAIAALAAYFVAKAAPKAAAKFADEFRNQSVAREERQRLRTQVLISLLRGRRQWFHQDTIAALNVVDFAFDDVPEVRSKYLLFVKQSTVGDADKLVKAYQDLTVEVARALGYGETMTEADMRLGYYPEMLGKLDESALIDAEEKLARRAAKEAPRTPIGDPFAGFRSPPKTGR